MPRPSSPFARSRPAAIALVALLVALSARETPPVAADDSRPAGDADPAALVVGAGPASATGAPATLVRVAAGDLAVDDGSVDGLPPAESVVPGPHDVAPPGPDEGYPHPVQYLTVEVGGAPMPLAFMEVSPTGPVNGRTVLLLHDRGDSGDSWAATIAALSAGGYRVLVPDQVGHGISARPGAELPVATLAAQAAILLDSLGAPRVAVVGDGLGAEVAVGLAAANAGLVDRLVLRPPHGMTGEGAAALRDPVRGRRVPVLVVGSDEEIDPLLLGFLGG